MSWLSNEPTNVGSLLFATNYWTSILLHGCMTYLRHTIIWRYIPIVPVLPVQLPDQWCVEVNLVMLYLLPVVLLEWFPISYSVPCLFEGSSASEAMALFYWYPTDFFVDSGYRISWWDVVKCVLKLYHLLCTADFCSSFFRYRCKYLATTLSYTWVRWFDRRNKGLNRLLLSIWCIQCGQINIELVDWGCILLFTTCFFLYVILGDSCVADVEMPYHYGSCYVSSANIFVS